MLIKNATILTPEGELQGDCLLQNGSIALVQEHIPDDAHPDMLDASGLYLAPGFIDLQLNGGFGDDFTANPETIWDVATQLPQYGVTGFLPTIITSPPETVAQAQQVMLRPHKYGADFRGATPLGLHLEGPYLNETKKGAHEARLLRPCRVNEIASWRLDKTIRLVTLAPELPGAEPMIAQLVEAGVVVSAGHSMATFDEAIRAFDAGVRYGTHLFNAMPPLHHREPNLPGALLADERVMIGLIPDGVHVHPGLIKTVWQAAKGRINVVTDSMAAMGCASGEYALAGRTVTVDKTSARLADDTLAGSIVTLDQALRNLIAWTGCTLAEAVATVTGIPADLLAMPQRGRIAAGCHADLVLLTPDCRVKSTFVAGELTYAQ